MISSRKLDTKGTFHAKMGSIKDRNGMDLQKQKILKEVARIHRRTTQNLDNHDSEITHLEPDIPECEVKGDLLSIKTNKASGGDGIPNPERRCCESAALNMPANLENSAVATGLEKVSFHSNPKERQCQGMRRLPHNCTHLTC